MNQGFQGRVIEILNLTRNKARSTYETLDVYLTYEHSSETLGAFFATFNLSQMLSQTFQEDASVAAFDFTGEYRFPEFRAQLHTAWTRHSYGLFANLNYVDGYRQLVPVSTQEFFGITNLQNEVDPFMTLDLGAQGKVFDLEVTFELINVFDEEPPFTNAVSIGYDAWHSPVGRQYRLAVTKRF